MSGSAQEVTPDEVREVMAHDLPEDVRLGVRLQGQYLRFHDLDAMVAFMQDEGLLSRGFYDKRRGTQMSSLYQRITSESRFSHRQSMPAKAMPEYITAIKESKDSTPLMAPVSRTVGARKIGDQVVPIRRSEVAGMDSRSIMEIFKEPLVREQLSFEEGVKVLEMFAAAEEHEGAIDDDEKEQYRAAIRMVARLAKRAAGQDGG